MSCLPLGCAHIRFRTRRRPANRYAQVSAVPGECLLWRRLRCAAGSRCLLRAAQPQDDLNLLGDVDTRPAAAVAIPRSNEAARPDSAQPRVVDYRVPDVSAAVTVPRAVVIAHREGRHAESPYQLETPAITRGVAQLPQTDRTEDLHVLFGVVVVRRDRMWRVVHLTCQSVATR